jgi:hypothetical protein
MMNGAKMKKKNLLKGNRHLGWPVAYQALLITF